MFAHDPNSLQEAEIAEVEPFGEMAYDGYAEAEPFAGYGEYYPPAYGVQMPQITLPGLTRQFWSAAENQMVTYRWDMFERRWVRAYPQFGGAVPPGWAQGGLPPHRRLYMRCAVWPGPAGLSPTNAMQPGQPGYPGIPGMPGQPGFPGQPGGGGGYHRRRRRRR